MSREKRISPSPLLQRYALSFAAQIANAPDGCGVTVICHQDEDEGIGTVVVSCLPRSGQIALYEYLLNECREKIEAEVPELVLPVDTGKAN